MRYPGEPGKNGSNMGGWTSCPARMEWTPPGDILWSARINYLNSYAPEKNSDWPDRMSSLPWYPDILRRSLGMLGNLFHLFWKGDGIEGFGEIAVTTGGHELGFGEQLGKGGGCNDRYSACLRVGLEKTYKSKSIAIWEKHIQ